MTQPFGTYVTTLASATSVAGADVLYVNQGGVSKQAAASLISPAATIVNNSTTITGGSTGKFLYDNAGIVGEATIGTGLSFSGATLSATATGGTTINVKSAPYSAVGNGVADDTTAINSAIAAFNTATNGILYFPAGTYKTTAALTVITANGIIAGDGSPNLSGQLAGAPTGGTLINCTANNVQTFTITNQELLFRDLALQNTAGSTPIAGSAGITVVSTNQLQKVDYNNIQVSGFYINIDIQVGGLWSMNNVGIFDPVLYGVKIRNTVNQDAGDWMISNCFAFTKTQSSTSAFRLESSGGGKIVNCKINCDITTTKFFGSGIDVQGTGVTIDLLIANCSIENVSTAAINLSGSWPNVQIINMESINFAGGGNSINIANTSFISIIGCMCNSPINITGTVTNCYVSSLLTNLSLASLYPGQVPDHDGSGGVGGNVYLAYALVASVVDQLSFTGTTGRFAILRAVTGGGTTRAAAMQCVNDGGFAAIMQMLSSANSQTSLQNKAMFGCDKGVVISSTQGSASGGGDDVAIRAGGWDTGAEVALATHLGSFVLGRRGALATNATDGFLYIPTCAGTPTGVPTSQTGGVAMVYDTTNNKFYIYNGAWKGGTNPGAFT